MYVLRLELGIIKFLESLERHLPQPIALRLELLTEHSRDRVKLEMLREMERMHRDVELLRKEISGMQSALHRINKMDQKSDKDDED